MGKKCCKKSSKKTIQCRDSVGNSWEAVIGKPNGGFKLPGSSQVFSVKGFVQWAERTLPTLLMPQFDIEDAGLVDFSTALAIAVPGLIKIKVKKKLVAIPKKKLPVQNPKTLNDLILQFLRIKGKATRVQIMKAFSKHSKNAINKAIKDLCLDSFRDGFSLYYY